VTIPLLLIRIKELVNKNDIPFLSICLLCGIKSAIHFFLRIVTQVWHAQFLTRRIELSTTRQNDDLDIIAVFSPLESSKPILNNKQIG
jgi:hypothetical protein